jgi:myo-inositol-1(or 4)-monophosphatase
MCALASRLAIEAGQIAVSRWGNREVSHKKDHSVVTDVDHEAQNHILSAISRSYPDHAVVAEETVAVPEVHAGFKDARYVWVIDPVDGTRNYVAGFPVFATAIGVLDRGVPVVGVVREHGRGDLYCARAGCGATCNGEPIHVDEQSGHSDVLLGFASGKDPFTVAVIQHWTAKRGYVLRNMGSTAAHIAMVASGALAGAFGRRVKLWDVAAGALLALEAGGRITDPFGEALIPFALEDPRANVPYLAGAPKVHEQLRESIRRALGAGGEQMLSDAGGKGEG